MNPRTTGMLLLVALALGAFVWFYEIEGEEGRREAESREKQLFPDVEAKDIESITFETSDGASVRLERSGEDGWKLVAPLDFPADSFAVDSLASTLADVASEAVFDDPQPPEEYGLADGARVVHFRAAGADHGLRLGRDTPLGGNVYAMVDGGDQITTVKGYQAKSFDKRLADLRERRILEFDRRRVARVEASWPGGAVTLERPLAPKPDDAEASEDAPEDAAPAAPEPAWRLVAPKSAEADGDAVDRLLSDLSYLRADDFVDAPSPDEEASLAEPDFAAHITLEPEEGGEPRTLEIAVGPVREGDKRLVRAGRPSLALISADRLSGIPLSVVQYRERTLSRFAASDAAQVDFFFQSPSGDPVAVTARREGGSWSASPEPIAPGKMERMVAELSQLKAGDIVADSADEVELAALGLSPPNTIITVFGSGEAEEEPDVEATGEAEADEPVSRERLAEIQIGRVEDSEWIVARAVGRPAVYRLDYELAEHLPVSLDALRNRFLAPPEPEPAPGEPEGDPLDFLTPGQESP